MSLADELGELGARIGADAERLAREGRQELEQHVQAHPQGLFALLRAVKPVLIVHDIAIVTRHQDVVDVLTHDDAFSVEPYTGKMRSLAGDFILGLDVTKRVPARLIGRWFGTPGPDEESMIAWTMAMFEDIFVNIKNDPRIHARAVDASSKLRAWLVETIGERKRAGGARGDTLLDRLIAMQSTPATALSDAAIVTNIIGLVVGFVPTIATATTFALDALLARPVALEGAQAAARAHDIDAVRAYMWEAMRLAPQGPGLLRRATRDFVIGEGTHRATRVPAGTVTFASTQSAMLDGDIVKDPDAFRVGRPAHHYLHFGAGLHRCFGRFANAMQIPLIAAALLRRPHFGRAPGDAGRLVKAGPYPRSLLVTL